MSMPSSPGKMDLNPLRGALKKRAVTTPPETTAPEAPATAEQPSPAVMEPTAPKSAPAPVEEVQAPETPPVPAEPAPAAATTAVKIAPAEEEHSGHVTLYLPKDLNEWLGEYHGKTGISYPTIILNAISWAAGENRFAQIFAPKDSPIPANDIFGRALAVAKPARGSVEQETRPLRFRKDHMQVIISLARTWTADNRNAFFVGVLNAYRTDQNKG